MRFNLTPETGINIVCLCISAAAPSLAIGPVVGVPTGAAIALGLWAVMKKQRSPEKRVRQQALWGSVIIRVGAAMFEQMAYIDRFAERNTLPFGWSEVTWAWLSTIFMAVLDFWALLATAALAASIAESIREKESIARMDEQNRQHLEAKERQKQMELENEFKIEQIRLQTQKDIEETRADIEKTRLDMEQTLRRQQMDIERQEADQRRQDEDRRRQQEDQERFAADQLLKKQQADADKKLKAQQKLDAERKEKQRIQKAKSRAKKLTQAA